ncbi:MAG: hypothetical protein NZ869_02235 [Thermoanaerobaculum sp.]|nr:hypothetical protein [Thermoanaerobaculum sp.]MDW7968351.1 hypothetical protein [Thermoanaerobaculum sp.]
MVRLMWPFGLCFALPLLAQPVDPLVVDVFRTQLDLEKRLLATELSQLERAQEEMRLACDRMLRLSEDLLRAQRDSEDAATLNARSADLRRAEAEVLALMGGAQQLRATLVARRAVIEQLTAEVKRLEESLQVVSDDLSGKWNVTIEPGGLRGTFDLRLFGTLVSGVYELMGGWRGSLRGTLVGNVVRLERIDSQLGFVAVYTGRLEVRGGERRLEGTWQATNLAAGLATSGTWLAQREAKR